ncbi:hypothetical protein GQ42DRAFT_119576, partial [Ramicandelaber brevisporus]
MAATSAATTTAGGAARFIVCLVLLGFALVSSVSAHMMMANPPPRRSKNSPFYVQQGLVDYDMTAPLGSSKPFPCRGFPTGPTTFTVQAGQAIPVQIEGSATHQGGHCQFSISYDGGRTFVVLQTVMSECLRGSGNSFMVTIPATAPPAESAVFSWSWINRLGAREYYQNCADIRIEGGVLDGSISGPELFVANLAGYPTIPE